MNDQKQFDERYPCTFSAVETPTPSMQVLCRCANDPDEPEGRAPTIRVMEASTKPPPFDGGAFRAVVLGFASADDEDRGGCVLSLSAESAGDSTFLPTARRTSKGVDIHIGGEHEARAFLISLRMAVEALLLRPGIT